MDYNLFSKITDYEELDIFIMSLKTYIEYLENFELSKKEGIEGEFTININATLRGIISNLYGDIFMKKDKIKSIYDSLLKIKKNAKMIELTFSTDINSSTKIKLKSFFQDKVNKDIILRYKIKPDIGGGLVINTPSNFFDFSFDYVLKSSTDKIIDIVKNG
jgi:F0F1-type ATP synthase delta subunit